jgi:ribosomal protein S13
MATRKQEIVRRITELERTNEANNNEIEALRKELIDTPDALLERDLEASVKESISRKNEILRQCGLLPR